MLKKNVNTPEVDSQTKSSALGWALTLKRAFFWYPGSALALLVSGLIGTVLETTAFAVAIICIQVLQSQESVTYFGFTLEYPLSTNVLIGCGLVFSGFMLMSALMHYFNGILLARTRRKTFRDMIVTSLEKFAQSPGSSFVTSQNSKALSRVLRRDCRYVSKATTDGLGLPRPLIVLTVAIVLGIIYYPEITLTILGILALSLPLHIAVGHWGARNMSRLLNSGANKSRADGEAIDSLMLSPFRLSSTASEQLAKDHADGREVQDFLLAYQSRVALVPTSMLISRLSYLAIFMAVGLVLALQWQNGELNFASIAILLIGIRFAAAASSELAQIITVISSYSPLIKGLLTFVSEPGTHPNAGFETVSELSLNAGRAQLPNRVFLIGDGALTWSLADYVSTFQDSDACEPQIISGEFSEIPSMYDLEPVRLAIKMEWKTLSDPTKTKVLQTLDGELVGDRVANSLIALKLLTNKDHPTALFWENRAFTELPSNDKRVILRSLLNTAVTVVYSSVPKRLPKVPGFDVWTLINGSLSFGCEADQYPDKREAFIEAFANAKKARDDAMDELDLDDL